MIDERCADGSCLARSEQRMPTESDEHYEVDAKSIGATSRLATPVLLKRVIGH